MELIIRKASTADMTEMSALCHSTIRSINSSHYDFEQIEAWCGRLTNERWVELFGGDLIFFVACDPNGKIVGLTSVNLSGYLHSMFVHRCCQRQGIARRLLEYVEQIARQSGARKLSSEVSITALPFFEQMGFAVIQEQSVRISGVKMINFAVVKLLKDG